MNVSCMLQRLSIKRPIAVASFLLLSALTSSTALAQSISLPNSILPEDQEGGDQQEQVDDTPRADWRWLKCRLSSQAR